MTLTDLILALLSTGRFGLSEAVALAKEIDCYPHLLLPYGSGVITAEAGFGDS